MTGSQIQTRQIWLHDVVASVKLVVARYRWISLIGGLLSKRRLGLASQTTWDLFDNDGEQSLRFGMNEFTSDNLHNTLRVSKFRHSLVI